MQQYIASHVDGLLVSVTIKIYGANEFEDEWTETNETGWILDGISTYMCIYIYYIHFFIQSHTQHILIPYSIYIIFLFHMCIHVFTEYLHDLSSFYWCNIVFVSGFQDQDSPTSPVDDRFVLKYGWYDMGNEWVMMDDGCWFQHSFFLRLSIHKWATYWHTGEGPDLTFWTDQATPKRVIYRGLTTSYNHRILVTTCRLYIKLRTT